MTITAEKPYPRGPHIPYSLYYGVDPPGKIASAIVAPFYGIPCQLREAESLRQFKRLLK